MSVSTQASAEFGAGAGGTGDRSGYGSGGRDAGPPAAVFALPFLGWRALADAVGETAPTIADLMTAASYLAQSALEERIPSIAAQLGDLLTTGGFSAGAVDGVQAALRADRLALSPRAAAEEVAACHADLGEEGQLLTGNEPQSLVEAAIAAFLDSDAAGPDARTVFDEMARRAAQYSSPHWWACCSLELPSVLGGRAPIQCVQPRFRFSERLVALEWTFGRRTFTGFAGKVTGRGPVRTTAADGGYRPSIDETRASYYWNTLAAPSTAQAFCLNLSDGRTWRWANKVAEFIEGHSEDIHAIMNSEIHVAQLKINDLLTAAKLTAYIHPLVGLMVSATQALVLAVSKILVKSLSDKSLTTWAIWHTAVMGQQRVPVSVFTLSQPGEATAGLQALTRGPDGSAELAASDDYSTDPVFLREARFMIGASELPVSQFDDAIFELTAGSRQPLAWREPLEAGNGFRVLVPHRSPGTKASYVSALRVDVQVEERPKTKFKHWVL